MLTGRNRIPLAAAALLELVAAAAFVIALVHEPPRGSFGGLFHQYAEPSILDDVEWGYVALVLGLAGLIPLLLLFLQPENRWRVAKAARRVGRRSNPLLSIEQKISC